MIKLCCEAVSRRRNVCPPPMTRCWPVTREPGTPVSACGVSPGQRDLTVVMTRQTGFILWGPEIVVRKNCCSRWMSKRFTVHSSLSRVQFRQKLPRWSLVVVRCSFTSVSAPSARRSAPESPVRGISGWCGGGGAGRREGSVAPCVTRFPANQ